MPTCDDRSQHRLAFDLVLNAEQTQTTAKNRTTQSSAKCINSRASWTVEVYMWDDDGHENIKKQPRDADDESCSCLHAAGQTRQEHNIEARILLL